MEINVLHRAAGPLQKLKPAVLIKHRKSDGPSMNQVLRDWGYRSYSPGVMEGTIDGRPFDGPRLKRGSPHPRVRRKWASQAVELE